MTPSDDGRHGQIAEDMHDLHRFGYAQQLYRDMGGFANFAVAFTVISVPTGTLLLLGWGLKYGGPAAETLGWPLVMIGTLAVTCSMAEIASAIPTAGAMYHWSALLGGPGWGWFTAWFNFVGQMAITAGIDYGIAGVLADLLGLGSGQAVVLALYAAVLLSHGLLNHYGIRTVARLNDISAWYHLALTAAIICAFAFWAPHRPITWAFTTGFGDGLLSHPFPYRWAFLVGLLQAQWTFTGYDASAHITEETVDPRRNAPWGMFLAVLLSGVSGYFLVLVLTLSVQDLGAAVDAEYAMVAIAEKALGVAAGKALIWSIVPAMWFCGLSSVTANARMIFAFARDRGLPGSAALAQVSPRYRTPAPAVWLSVALAFAVAVYSGAFNVITSISTIGLYVSYILPVALVLRERRRGRWTELGPWNLGRYGGWVNALALLWTGGICVLFVAPPNQLTGYTFAGLSALLAVYYFAAVRGRFLGPKKVGTEEDLMRLERELDKTSVYHEE